MKTETDLQLLARYGWHVGARDARINTKHAGAFMVCEPFEDSELPTPDGANGPWAIAGDDLDSLVSEAAQFLREIAS